MTAVAQTTDQRERFYGLLPELLRDHERLVFVAAQIGIQYVADVDDLADRVINVGIREQLAISVAGGLALTGMRPIVHTFPPFLIERPFEQVKLDLGHQDVGAVLVSALGSYSWPGGGETHFGPRDVPLLDTLDGWTVHVPGHADEAEAVLRQAVHGNDRVYLRLDPTSNCVPRHTGPGFETLRSGTDGTVLAVGPMADRVLAATEGLDVTVLYASTVRPFDATTLARTLSTPDVVVVEPYLAGTSDREVNRALAHLSHRVLGLGVGRAEVRRYGEVADHDAVHGLDVAGLRRSITGFLA